jgi:pimeloyl-ACP methyl ester carboxylesterase
MPVGNNPTVPKPGSRFGSARASPYQTLESADRFIFGIWAKSYPKWQQWLRDHQPPLLVLWGRYDTSFTVAGGEAYCRDDPHAEVHILDAGHFALDLKAQEIVMLTEAAARSSKKRKGLHSITIASKYLHS